MAHTQVLRDTPSAARPFVGPAVMSLASLAHVVLRVGAGLLFMQHGIQKLFGALGGNAAPLMSQMGLAGILEFGGGLLLVVGLFTRPVAAILFCEMLVAYFIAHLPRGGWPIENGGELALLYAIVFAWLATHGAGPLSADASWRRRG